MYISCTICSDGIVSSSEIYATYCGHMFHYVCLTAWIERSKTCPQCRSKVTDKTIHRIYIDESNTDGIVDDVATLQSKVDNFQFQLRFKEKDVKNLTEKYKKVKHQNQLLREEVCKLENQIRVHDSIVSALKDQISFFKDKSKERDRLAEEVAKMKTKLKGVELVQNAIDGTREEVNEMLKTENDKESLVILAASLKKALLDTEKQKLTIEHKFKQLQNDTVKYRKHVSTLEASNKELRNEVESLKKNSKPEKLFLNNIVCTNGDSSRILFESPAPAGIRSRRSAGGNVVAVDSPSLEEKVADIVNSDSPYLRIQSSNSLGIVKPSQVSCSPRKISIFKRPSQHTEVPKRDEVVYSGLGGQTVQDVFPSSRNSFLHNKKHKANSSLTMSSAKFRKLNPSNIKSRGQAMKLQ